MSQTTDERNRVRAVEARLRGITPTTLELCSGEDKVWVYPLSWLVPGMNTLQYEMQVPFAIESWGGRTGRIRRITMMIELDDR